MCRCAAGAWIALGLVLVSPVFGQAVKKGSAAAPSLARYIPESDYTIYGEFDGLDAHDAAWRKTDAYGLLNQTSFGALLSDLVAQAIDAARKDLKDRKLSGKEIVAGTIRFARRGGAVAARKGKEGANDDHFVMVFRGGGASDARGIVDGIVDMTPLAREKKAELRKGSRQITRVGEGDNAMATWVEKGDAVVCDLDWLDTVLATVDGTRPSMERNASRARLAPSAGFEPLGVAYADLTKLPQDPSAAPLGFGGMKRIDLRLGFENDTLVTTTDIAAPAPRKGVLALLDQPTFSAATMPALPAAATGFTMVSVDVARTYDAVVTLMKESDPARAAGIANGQQSINAMLLLDLRRDLLPHLGPKLLLYSAPEVVPEGAPLPPQVAGMMSLALGLELNNGPAAMKAIDTTMQSVGKQLGGADPAQPGTPLRRQAGPPVSWTFSMPGALPPGIEPTLVVGKKWLGLAMGRAPAAAIVAEGDKAGGRWQPARGGEAMARLLPRDMITLMVSDPRQTLPELMDNLPMVLQQMNAGIAREAAKANPNAPPPQVSIRLNPALVPKADAMARWLKPGSFALTTDRAGLHIVSRESIPNLTNPGVGALGIALLLPAVQAAREAARRSQCINNEKQIGLALHNYYSVNDRFPRPAIVDKNGKPLLSWRVTILPYIEEQALYERFHLDEPWDSPHNKTLLESMPKTYACPSVARPVPGMTSYRGFTGKTAFFMPGADVTLRDFTDGTSRTIAVVETKDGVPWTKPDDLPFDPAEPNPPPLFGAGSYHTGGFNALFGDGSVRFWKNSMSIKTLSAAITRNGGEVYNLDTP